MPKGIVAISVDVTMVFPKVLLGTIEKGVLRRMRSKAVSETRFMGVSLFAMAVVITWSAFAYVALYNKDIALPVMKICNVMTVVAAVIGVAYIYTSSHLSYDENLERLHARRDATVLLSLAVDFIAANTLLGLLIDTMNHDLSIVPMMSAPATMAGVVVMITTVVSMIVLTVIGKAERQLRQEERLSRGGREILFRQGQEVVTAYDVRQTQLASRAYYDEDAKVSGDIQSYIPLSQIGISKIGRPSEYRPGIPKAKPETEQTAEQREMPLRNPIAEMITKKKEKLAKIVPEVDRQHTDESLGAERPPVAPAHAVLPDDTTLDEPANELDEPMMPEVMPEELDTPDVIDLTVGKPDAESINNVACSQDDDRLCPVADTGLPLAEQSDDDGGDGRDGVSKQDAETSEDSMEDEPEDEFSRYEMKTPRTGMESSSIPVDDGHGDGEDPEVEDGDDVREDFGESSHGNRSVLWYVIEFFAIVGEHCVAVGSRIRAWFDRTWPTVTGRVSELASACRDAFRRAWASIVLFAQEKGPALKRRTSSVGHRIADGTIALVERGMSLIHSVTNKVGIAVSSHACETDASDDRIDGEAGKNVDETDDVDTRIDGEPNERADGTSDNDGQIDGNADENANEIGDHVDWIDDNVDEKEPNEPELLEPASELMADATDDEDDSIIAATMEDRNLPIDHMGQEATQEDGSPLSHTDLSDKAVPPFLKKILDTPYMKDE